MACLGGTYHVEMNLCMPTDSYCALPEAGKRKLYMVELLRIWFISCVIVCHLPCLRADVMQVLHTSGQAAYRAVEFFYIIGGFFLYKKLVHGTQQPYETIKRIYFRLLPVTLFALVLTVTLGASKLAQVPFALAHLNALGFRPTSVVGGGDWFISVYFWVSCLLVGIFQTASKYRWLWLGALVYLCMMLKLYAPIIPNSGHKETYGLYQYWFISAGLVRGIVCMGIGMFSSFLADKISLPDKWPLRLLCTVVEIACLVSLFNFLLNTKHSHLSYFEALLSMAGLMISISHSWGYISSTVNKWRCVQYVSRYCLSFLIGHMVCLSILRRFHHFGWNDYSCEIFVIGGCSAGSY